MRVVVLLVLSLAAQAQLIVRRGPLPMGGTPAFVSSRNSSTSSTNAFSTPFKYHVYLPEVSLASNTLVVAVKYSDTPSSTLAVSDDQSNTWTCTTAVDQATDSTKVAFCYSVGAVANTRKVDVTFSAAVTNVHVQLMQWKDVGAFDALSAGATGSSTTLTGGNITPTQIADIILDFGCRTQTTATTGFTAGSGQSNITWAKVPGLSDVFDGCMVQWGIYNSTSTFNPQFTMVGSTRFAGTAIAFKAASQGSLPTGMYPEFIQAQTTPDSSSGNFTYDVAASSADNLISFHSPCGQSMQPTSATDSHSNTWEADYTGGYGLHNGHAWAFHAANATLSADQTVTVNTTGTGDCTFMFIGWRNAATSFHSGSWTTIGNQVSVADLTTGTFAPGFNSGYSVSTAGITVDTCTGSPSPSGSLFTSDTYDGQDVNGPSRPDQNNCWRLYKHTNQNAQTDTWSLTGGAAAQNWDATVSIYPDQSATKYPMFVQSSGGNTVTTNTHLAAPAITTATSNLLWAFVTWNVNTATMSCSDNVNGSWTAIQSPHTGSGTGASWRVQAFYKSGITGGSTTVTCTSSATITGGAIAVHEAQGVTTLDQSDAGKNGTGTTGTSNTTGTIATALEYAVGGCWVANAVSDANSPWTLRENTNISSNGTADQTTLATGTVQLSVVVSSGAWNCLVDTFQ